MSESPPAPEINYFKTVLVPTSRPDTAAQMLELATSLVHPEKGKVIALVVGISDEGEATSKRMEALEPIVSQFDNVKMETQIASSITRGILDGAREHGAEAIIMGVQRSERLEVKLGDIARNVVTAAPCNVLIYRTGDRSDYERVIVPLDNNTMTPMALHVGALIAKSHDCPIDTPYIQRDYTSSKEKEARIQETLDILDEELMPSRRTITGRNPAETLLAELNGRDLLVLGFSQRANLELEFGRDLSDILLRRASGPVLLYSQILEERDTVLGQVQRQLQRFNPALTQVERNELVWSARKNAAPSIDYNVLILMAASLACFGLLVNSTAVIIGAMLVAPLMSPLGALAIGLAVGEMPIARRSVFTLIQGVLLALLISITLGLILPNQNPTSEMLSRGNPSLLDAGVAFASGLVAAFALARKEIPVALAGVAIAAALMPPVCTIGLGIALQNPRLAGGAALLFLTNISFIVAAQNIVFLWLGMRPGRRQATRIGVALWWSLITAIMIVAIALLLRLGQDATEEVTIEDFLLERMAGSEFVSVEEREREDGSLSVLFTVRSSEAIRPQRVAELETSLETFLGRDLRLDIVNLQVVESPSEREQMAFTSLQVAFPDGRISDIQIEETENLLLIEASLITATAPSAEDINRAEANLEMTLGKPITLSLLLQIRLTAPEITPEATEAGE